MGYVDSNLLPGEVVIHRAKLSKILFFWHGLFAAGFLTLSLWLLFHSNYNQNYAGICFIVSVCLMLPSYTQYISSEFAVTNKRVIVKLGIIRRQTMETLLQKIEAVGVNQSIMGRIFNYGTITVIGTGGTNESFQNIANPLGFRRAVQEQADVKEGNNSK